jgi:hypothetical protein
MEAIWNIVERKIPRSEELLFGSVIFLFMHLSQS